LCLTNGVYKNDVKKNISTSRYKISQKI